MSEQVEFPVRQAGKIVQVMFSIFLKFHYLQVIKVRKCLHQVGFHLNELHGSLR